MYKKYRIEYHLANRMLVKILDFEGYDDALSHVKKEYEEGFHTIYNGRIQLIPSSKVIYFDIQDNKEYLEKQKKINELTF